MTRRRIVWKQVSFTVREIAKSEVRVGSNKFKKKQERKSIKCDTKAIIITKRMNNKKNRKKSKSKQIN